MVMTLMVGGRWEGFAWLMMLNSRCGDDGDRVWWKDAGGPDTTDVVLRDISGCEINGDGIE